MDVATERVPWWEAVGRKLPGNGPGDRNGRTIKAVHKVRAPRRLRLKASDWGDATRVLITAAGVTEELTSPDQCVDVLIEADQ